MKSPPKGSSPRSATAARAVVVVLAVLAVAACAVALKYGLDWHDASSDDRASSTASARDDVLEHARTAVVTLTTLDSGDPQTSVQAWGAVTTGALHQAVADAKGRYQQLITSGHVDTTSAVQDAAVESLDSAHQSAVVLVGLDITLTPAQGQATVRHERLVVTMDRTDDGWRASRLENVAD